MEKISSFMKNSLLFPDLTLAWKNLSTHQQGQEPPCLAYGCVVRAEGEAKKRELSPSMSMCLMEM